MTGNEPTQLYRHFDAQGRLLYVGISLSAVARLTQHRNSSDWYSQISRVEIQKFDTRLEAEGAEWEAIQKENPIHNIIGNKPTSRLSKFEREKRPFYYKPLHPICWCLYELEVEILGQDEADEALIDVEKTLTQEQIVYGIATKAGIYAKAFCDHCGGSYKVHETKAESLLAAEGILYDDHGLKQKWPYLPKIAFRPKDRFFSAFLKTCDEVDQSFGKENFYTWGQWSQLWLYGMKQLEVA